MVEQPAARDVPVGFGGSKHDFGMLGWPALGRVRGTVGWKDRSHSKGAARSKEVAVATAGHVDVLIVGAGLSGIGAACHLQRAFPQRTYVLLESRGALGGTWDQFRFPGVRSDSDMYTLGYRFKPWRGEKSVADGADILEYLREAAVENGVDRRIRFRHRVTRAEWSSVNNRWTVCAERTDTGETIRFTAGFLLSCSGYYRYDAGYTPRFAGIDRFAGRVVHPQFWPSDLEVAGERVVLIGSGATAVTLAPALAAQGAHVTMVQRSPSYVVAKPAYERMARAVRWGVPVPVVYSLARVKHVLMDTGDYGRCRRHPDASRRRIRRVHEHWLPPGYDIDTHFTPQYNPWDQRLCFTPDGEFFRAIQRGDVDIVTDGIDTFTETGLRLTSGTELEANVVITATGFQLLPFGGVELVVDDTPVIPSEQMSYKTMMLSGVPNFAYVIGFFNISWTLKLDLVSQYIVRLLRYMTAHHYVRCVPVRDPSVDPLPEFQGLTAGYVRRGAHRFPVQGESLPWRLRMNFVRNWFTLRFSRVADSAMRFERAPQPAEVGAEH